MDSAFAADCDVHLVPMDPESGCIYCLRFLGDAPDAKLLPVTVKLIELEQWLTARRSVPEEMLYQRIEQLVGRKISLHELRNPDELLRRAQRPKRNFDWDDW
jgi:DNA-binding transcriptional regulator YdaS (Cro superfamily)